MSAREGVSRVAKAVRWAGYVAGFVIVAGGWYLARGSAWESDQTFFRWVSIITGFGIAGLGHALAWIIDGFAADP